MSKITILSFLLSVQQVLSDQIFVVPWIACSGPCTGDLATPYDNLWAALNHTPSSNQLNIILLNSTQDHYMFLTEMSTPPTVRYNWSSFLELQYSITISPLFCNNPMSNSTLSSYCIPPTSILTVYAKTEQFRLLISGGSLTIESIHFSWVEDIGKYNPMSNNLELCIYERVRCCSGTAYNGKYGLQCTGLIARNPIGSFISVSKISIYQPPLGMVIANCEFSNIDFAFTESIFAFDFLDIVNFQLVTLNDFDVNSVFAPHSFQADWAATEFKFTALNVYKTNPLYQKLSVVLLTLPTIVSTQIEISESNFHDFSVPLQCLIQSSTAYTLSVSNSAFLNIAILSTFSSSLFNVTTNQKLILQGSMFGNVTVFQGNSIFNVNSGGSINLVSCSLQGITFNGDNSEIFLLTNSASLISKNMTVSLVFYIGCENALNCGEIISSQNSNSILYASSVQLGNFTKTGGSVINLNSGSVLVFYSLNFLNNVLGKNSLISVDAKSSLIGSKFTHNITSVNSSAIQNEGIVLISSWSIQLSLMQNAQSFLTSSGSGTITGLNIEFNSWYQNTSIIKSEGGSLLINQMKIENNNITGTLVQALSSQSLVTNSIFGFNLFLNNSESNPVNIFDLQSGEAKINGLFFLGGPIPMGNNINLIYGLQTDQIELDNSMFGNLILLELLYFKIMNLQTTSPVIISNSMIINNIINPSSEIILISISSSPNITLSSLQVKNSSFFGQVSLFEMKDSPQGSCFNLQNMAFLDYNKIYPYDYVINFINLQNGISINVEDLVISNNNAFTNLTRFLKVSDSIINISNVIVDNNIVVSNHNWSTAIIDIWNSQISQMYNITIQSNTINYLNPYALIPDVFSPVFSFINLTNCSAPNINFLSSIGNMNLDTPLNKTISCNSEIITIYGGNYTINNVLIAYNYIGWACYGIFQLATVTLTNFRYTNNTNYGASFTISKGTITYRNVQLDNNPIVKDLLVSLGSQITLENGYFFNNIISFPNAAGILSLLQCSGIINNITARNETAWVVGSGSIDSNYMQVQTSSTVKMSNFELEDVLSLTYNRIFNFNTITQLELVNWTLQNFTKHFNFISIKLVDMNLFIIDTVTGTFKNISFMNSMVMLYVVDSTINFSDIFISDAALDESNYEGPGLDLQTMGNLFTLVTSTINFTNLEIINFAPSIYSNNIFKIYFGTINFTQISIQNLQTGNGSLFFIQNVELTFYKGNFQTIHFDSHQSLISASNLELLNLIDCTFLDTSGLLYSSASNTIIMNNVFFDSSYQMDNFMEIFFSNSIFFTALQIRNIQPTYYAVDLENCGNISIQSSTFQNIESPYGPVYVFQSISQTNLTIKSTIFKDNIAKGEASGALTLTFVDGEANIYDSQFIFNSAKQNENGEAGGLGGAVGLFTTSKQASSPSFTFQNCQFLNNYADLHGGAIYVYGEAPNMIMNSFSSNMVGAQSNEMGSQAVTLMSLSDYLLLTPNPYSPRYLNYSTVIFKDVPTNQPLDSSFGIVSVDLFGQPALYDSTSILTINTSNVPYPQISISRDIFRASRGIYSFEGIFMNFSIGETGEAELTTSNFSTFANILPLSQKSSQFNFSAQFRNCITGENVITVQTPNITYLCHQCPFGMTQLSNIPNYQGECTPCLSTMVCKGGANIGPAPGYWIMNLTSNLILRCPVQDACPGGVLPNSCATGYEGNLCADCQPGYGKRSGGLDCSECSTYFSVYIVMLLKIVFLIWLIVQFPRMNQFQPGQSLIMREKVGVLKILINYIQTFSCICSILILWPGQVQTFVAIMETFFTSQDDYFGLDCAFSGYNTENKYFSEFVVFSFMPIICCIFFLIGLITLRKIWTSDDLTMRRQAGFSIGMIFFLFYPSVSRDILSIFSCYNIYRTDTSYQVLYGHYDVICGTSKHIAYLAGLGVPLLLIWIIGLPMIAYLMIKDMKPYEKVKISFFALMARGYRRDKLNWEVVQSMKKISILLIVIFGGIYSTAFQIFFLIYLVWVFYYLQNKYLPYLTKEMNDLEMTSITCLGITIMCGVYFELVSSNTQDRGIFISLLFITNFYFLGSVGIFYLSKSEKFLHYFKKVPNQFPKVENLFKISMLIHKKLESIQKNKKFTKDA